MHPDLFTIPIIDYPVKSYGAMLTVGFLLATWIAMKRAERVKADPDIVLNIGFVALISGIIGARIFYVAHYWESNFANQPSPLMAALNVTGGGLEYYGGLICGIVGVLAYVYFKRASVRMYVDIVTPSVVFGLAFGRMGCLLNGCCWGGVCVDAHGHEVVPWGITFPHASGPQARQWENRQLTLPAELIVSDPSIITLPMPLWNDLLEMPVEKLQGPQKQVRDLERQIEEMKALGMGEEQIQSAEAELKTAKKALEAHLFHIRPLHDYATHFPSREEPSRPISVSELDHLANEHRSLKVHPAQVYGIINALLLSALLTQIFYRRKRHGIVFAIMCLIYPITRVILETVRVDNPHDTAGLTISQGVSIGMFVFGLLTLIAIYRMPLRSPKAVPFVPPPRPEDEGKDEKR